MLGKIVVGLALGFVLLAPVSSAEELPPVKIGFVTEMTGAWSFGGATCTSALKFAEKELNPPGKRKLEFIIRDDQTSPAQAIAAARSLDTQDNVLAFTGTTNSDTALAVYGYAEQNKVPFMVPTAAFPQLTKPGTHYTFRMEPNAVGWGYAIAKFVEQKKPGAKIALIYSDYALMRAIFAGLKYQAPRSGLQIVADISFPQGAADATVQAAQVLAAQPDFVVAVGAGGFDNTLTSQLLDIGIKPEQIIHPYGLTTQLLSWGKPSIGSYYGTFFDANLDNLTAEGKSFVEQFTAQYDRVPSFGENFCYITAKMIRETLDKNPDAADSREKFRDALSSLKTQEPTSGIPITFDKNGARKEYFYIMQVEDVAAKNYKAKKVFYAEWDADVIPVYSLIK